MDLDITEMKHGDRKEVKLTWNERISILVRGVIVFNMFDKLEDKTAQ